MSDVELQRKLAELLRAKLYVAGDNHFFWHAIGYDEPRRVLRTEWLHVCWLIEQTFDGTRKAMAYAMQLKYEIEPKRGLVGNYRFVTASWQQRAKAILAIKGVK